MPVINVKTHGMWHDIASSYNHIHTMKEITDLPASLVDDVEALKDKVGAESVAYQITTAVKTSEYVHPNTHPANMITGLSDVAISGDYNDLKNLPEEYIHPESHPASMIDGLATIATSGDYNDLSNKPTIPSIAGLATKTYVDEQIASVGGSGIFEQVQSDWDETDTTSPAYIKNKPVISGDGGASVQANWNQADESQPDFIKNKPFGEYNADIALIDGSYKWVYYGNDYWDMEAPIPITSDTHLEEGKTYTVTWNDTEYTCECFMYMGVAGAVGNGAVLGGDNTGEPFIIVEDAAGLLSGTPMFVFIVIENPDPTVTTEVTYDIKLTYNGVAIKKIDAKYLHRPDWNIIDESNSGCIMNKPFGKYPAGSVWCDGSLTFYGSEADDDGNTKFIYMGVQKVNMIPADGHTLYLTVNGTTYDGVITVNEWNNMSVTYTIDGKDFVVESEAGALAIIVITYIEDLTTITLTFGNDEIQKIQEEYLPSSLPKVTTSDNNKVMTVIDGEWTAQTPASGLPEVTTSDAGKFLRVSSSGAWVAELIPSAEGASF